MLLTFFCRLQFPLILQSFVNVDIIIIGKNPMLPNCVIAFSTCHAIFYSSHAVILATLQATNSRWFCNSVDLIDSILSASPYCTLSGGCMRVALADAVTLLQQWGSKFRFCHTYLNNFTKMSSLVCPNQ